VTLLILIAGKRIKCHQLHSKNAIILGDAAHAVTPVFGQGANSALESCRVLDNVLTACTNPATGKVSGDSLSPQMLGFVCGICLLSRLICA